MSTFSLHLIPLNKQGEVPLLTLSTEDGSIAAVTDNGRVSWLPASMQKVVLGRKMSSGFIGGIPKCIKDTIKQQFPHNKTGGYPVQQYVALCVWITTEHDARFIFRIVGLIDKNEGIEHLYTTLSSLKVAPANSPFSLQMQQWINRTIAHFKAQGWDDYVRERLSI